MQLGLLVGIGICAIGLKGILKVPFKYPYFVYTFDITNNENTTLDNLIDNFLISGGIEQIVEHENDIQSWKRACQRKIDKSIIKGILQFYYNSIIDDLRAYKFNVISMQPYTNQLKFNYQYSFSYRDLSNRYEQLRDSNYVVTKSKVKQQVSDDFVKAQRRAMTRNLRVQIMQRDNYTCQICGKYMPDEVGLQIDHIIPVAKGGMSVPSNLQVLCSKCNGRKSDRI